MDVAFLQRVDSHAGDLFKLGGQGGQGSGRFPAIRRARSSPRLELVPEDGSSEAAQVAAPLRPSDLPSVLPLSGATRWRTLSKEQLSTIHYDDLFGAVTRNFGKGFVCLGGFRVGINAFRILVAMMRGGRIGLQNPGGSEALWPMGVITEVLRRIVGDAQQWGMFGGSLLAIINGTMYVSRDTDEGGESGQRKQRSAVARTLTRYRGAIAGALSSLALLALPPSLRSTFALFVAVRAFEVQGYLASHRKFVPAIPHADAALMSAASAVVMFGYVSLPGTLEPSYTRFLNQHVQTSTANIRALDTMGRGQMLDVDALPAANVALSIPDDFHMPQVYDGVTSSLGGALEGFAMLLYGSPKQPLLLYAARRWIAGLRLAIPVYVPVYLTSTLLFSSARVIKSPVKELTRILRGIATSSIFLTSYCTVGVCTVTLLRTLGLRYSLMGRASLGATALAGAMAGWTVILEKKSRRIELALFVWAKAMDIFWQLAQRSNTPFLSKFITGLPGQVLLFGAAMSSIMHAYVRHPQFIRRTYLSMLRRFLDSDARHVFI